MTRLHLTNTSALVHSGLPEPEVLRPRVVRDGDLRVPEGMAGRRLLRDGRGCPAVPPRLQRPRGFQHRGPRVRVRSSLDWL